jgi:hypothetical protein
MPHWEDEENAALHFNLHMASRIDRLSEQVRTEFKRRWAAMVHLGRARF